MPSLAVSRPEALISDPFPISVSESAQGDPSTMAARPPRPTTGAKQKVPERRVNLDAFHSQVSLRLESLCGMTLKVLESRRTGVGQGQQGQVSRKRESELPLPATNEDRLLR